MSNEKNTNDKSTPKEEAGVKDVVATTSLRKDGTPDQTPNYEVFAEAGPEERKGPAVKKVERQGSSVRTASKDAPEKR